MNTISTRLACMPWQDFQRLACDFFRITTQSEVTEWGRNGQSQDGVDIAIWNNAMQIKAVAQCKRWREVDNRDLELTFKKFISAKNDGALCGKYGTIDSYTLFTTATIDDICKYKTWDIISKFTDFCQSNGIYITIVWLDKIVSWLKNNEQIAEKYFRHWKFFEYGQIETALPPIIQCSDFSPLLRTIRRSEHASSIEALEAISSIVKTTPNEALSHAHRWTVLKELLNDDQFHVDWELRRSLGAALGSLLNSETHKENYTILAEAWEVCARKPNLMVTLATALSHITAAISPPHSAIIVELFRQPHPQVSWQLAKESTKIRRTFGMEQFEIATRHSGNDWVQERLSLTSLRESLIKGGNIDLPAIKRTLPIRSRFRELFSNLEKILCGDFSSLNTTMLIDGICLQADIHSNSFQRRAGKGRYGTIARVLSNMITEDPLAAVLVTDCADEGGRWALANSIPSWGRKLSKHSLKSVLTRLAEDTNPWTVRETLFRLKEISDRLSSKEINEILNCARRTIEKAERDGWDTTEMREAYINVISLHPQSYSGV